MNENPHSTEANPLGGRVSCPRLEAHQLSLLRQLRKLDSKLADIYLGAVSLVKDRTNPDRLALASHGYRELMNRVVHPFSPERGALRERLGDRVDAIKKRWTGLMSVRSPSIDGWSGEIDNELAHFLDELGVLFRWWHAHRPARRDVFRRMFRNMDGSGRRIPLFLEDQKVSRWMKLLDKLIAVAHHSRPPEEAAFLGILEEVEYLLLDHLAPKPFEDFEEIDQIISDEDDHNA